MFLTYDNVLTKLFIQYFMILWDTDISLANLSFTSVYTEVVLKRFYF